MSGELPEGWTEARLDDLVSFVLGGDWGKEPDELGDGLVKVRVIRGTEFRLWRDQKGAGAAERCIKVSSLEKRRLLSGDIVLEVSGGGPNQPVGRTALIDDQVLKQADAPLVCSNFFRQLRLHSGIEPRFVSFFLEQAYCKGAFNGFQTETTNLRNLNVADFLNKTEVRIAPLPEQIRIVAKLEELLGKVHACKERLDRVPVLLKRFRQAVLTAACSGQLSADWRDQHPEVEAAEDLIRRTSVDRRARVRKVQSPSTRKEKMAPREFDNCEPRLRNDLDLPELPATWRWVDLRFLMTPEEPYCYGVVQPGEDTPRGPRLIRVCDIDNDSVQVTSLRGISPDIHAQYHRSVLRGGEVLVTVVGTIGRSAIAPQELAGANVARAVAKLPIREFDARFVQLWLATSAAEAWMLGDAREVARKTLNLEQLQTLPVPLPPAAEQAEIVDRARALVERADEAADRLSRAHACAHGLTTSLLLKAFRGELVPTEAELARREGRSFETATVLLERIRERRDHAKKRANDRVRNGCGDLAGVPGVADAGSRRARG